MYGIRMFLFSCSRPESDAALYHFVTRVDNLDTTGITRVLLEKSMGYWVMFYIVELIIILLNTYLLFTAFQYGRLREN